MSRPTKNLLGMRVGILEVVAQVPWKLSKRPNGQTRRDAAWLCRCLCGRTKEVLADNLLGGRTNSCGHCLRRKPGSLIQSIIRTYKHGAKQRGYVFSLSDEEFISIIGRSCFYCGLEPSNVQFGTQVVGPEILIYSGIDRLKNSVGYVLNNCVSCCFECNKSKGERDDDKFIEHCKLIARRFS